MLMAFEISIMINDEPCFSKMSITMPYSVMYFMYINLHDPMLLMLETRSRNHSKAIVIYLENWRILMEISCHSDMEASVLWKILN